MQEHALQVNNDNTNNNGSKLASTRHQDKTPAIASSASKMITNSSPLRLVGDSDNCFNLTVFICLTHDIGLNSKLFTWCTTAMLESKKYNGITGRKSRVSSGMVAQKNRKIGNSGLRK